jgi:hypothetical protein
LVVSNVDNTRLKQSETRARRWCDDPWCAMTMDEADAWRTGWTAAHARALQLVAGEIDKRPADAPILMGAIEALMTMRLPE